jgi:hypothetical protein
LRPDPPDSSRTLADNVAGTSMTCSLRSMTTAVCEQSGRSRDPEHTKTPRHPWMVRGHRRVDALLHRMVAAGRDRAAPPLMAVAVVARPHGAALWRLQPWC